MFLVTTFWRGRLHVEPMRIFDNLDDAKAYAKTLNRDSFFLRIYEVSSNQEPKKIGIEDE